MEHYFRTALWISVLIGCLQAAPAKKDYRFESLRDVTCHENVTFRSPKKVLDSCPPAAVPTIIEGLLHALEHCEQCQDCTRSLDALDRVNVAPPAQNSSECKTDQVGSLTFGTFLEEFEHVIEKISSVGTTSSKKPMS